MVIGRELRTKSVPLLLLERSRSDPSGIAYRTKHLGLYRERTWAEYAALVGRCALGFKALGLRPGERIAIMADACEEWMIADLGAQAAGAITYGIYPTASPAEVEYQMRDGGATIFIAESQEYVDKILPIAEQLPALPYPRARHRDHPTAALRAAAALRRGLRGLAPDPLRGRAGGAFHGASLSSEIRVSRAGRNRRHLALQARRLRGGDDDRPAPCAATLGGRRGFFSCLRGRAGAYLSPVARAAWPGRAPARDLRRRRAAAGNDGALANLGRERRRDLRADRGSRCDHQRPEEPVPAPGQRGRHRARLGAAPRGRW